MVGDELLLGLGVAVVVVDRLGPEAEVDAQFGVVADGHDGAAGDAVVEPGLPFVEAEVVLLAEDAEVDAEMVDVVRIRGRRRACGCWSGGRRRRRRGRSGGARRSRTATTRDRPVTASGSWWIAVIESPKRYSMPSFAALTMSTRSSRRISMSSEPRLPEESANSSERKISLPCGVEHVHAVGVVREFAGPRLRGPCGAGRWSAAPRTSMAWPPRRRRRGALDDDGGEALLAQPVGEGGAGDAGAGDENGAVEDGGHGVPPDTLYLVDWNHCKKIGFDLQIRPPTALVQFALAEGGAALGSVVVQT